MTQSGDSPAAPTEDRLCSHANYSDLFLRILDTGLLVNADTLVIEDANDAAERLLNLPLDKIIGTSVLSWVIEGETQDFEKNLRVAKRRYYPRKCESVWKLPEEKIINVHIEACMLQLNDGREILQVLARDITSEKEAEKKIAGYIAELEVLNAKLEELSTTDFLTGLSNHRHFKTKLSAEHDRCQRYGSHYALILFDADNFKHYNDRNGHPAGDVLLKEFGAILKNACRDTDVPARYGGEEFVVLCPSTDWQGALVLAERIRKTIETKPFPFGEHQPLGKVSVSVGVSSFPVDGQDWQHVLEAADKALYESKHAGRNRVTASAQLLCKEKSG